MEHAVDEAPVTNAAVDITMASAFLNERFAGGANSVESLRQGAWSSAYGFKRDGTAYVIRFSNHVDDFARDRHARRFVAPNLPIPIVTEIGEAFGVHYAISERLSGAAIDDLDGDNFRKLLPSLFAMLDDLRRASVAGTSGFGGWNEDRQAPFDTWADFLLSVDHDDPAARGGGWKENLARSRIGMASFEECLALLREAILEIPNDRYLVHSDLLNANVLVNDARISGVLDWGCSLYGDFLYDLAWFVFWLPWYPAWSDVDLLEEAQQHYQEIGLAVPKFGARMRACLLHIGLGHIAYNAFLKKWDEAERVSELTLRIARGDFAGIG